MAVTLEAGTESSLRALGEQADLTESPSEFEVSEQAEPQPAPAKQAPDTAAKEDSQPPIADDKSNPESAEPAAEKVADPLKDETPYQKAKREGKEREASAWQKIEAEKAAIQAERERLEAERNQAPLPKQYRADEYEVAAQKAEEAAREAQDFDPEKASEHLEAAKALREHANQARNREFEHAINSNFESTAKELGLTEELKDPNSEAGKQLKAIIALAPQVFAGNPEGPKAALHFYKAQKDATAVPALKAKVEELTKENERLVKATSIPRSGPTKTANDTAEKDLSERDIRRMAAEYDATMPA